MMTTHCFRFLSVTPPGAIADSVTRRCEFLRVAFFAVILCVASLVAFDGSSEAGEFNPVLSIGDSAPAWSDLPGTDGKQHSSSDFRDSAAVVIVFTCNSCPYAVDAEDRLIALEKEYRDRRVSVIAINVNLVEDDLMPAMKAKATEKKLEFPYLFDETQGIARDFGAKYTPEFFVLDDSGKVAYMGSMDDSPDGREVSKRYVRDAIDAVLSGVRPEVTETVPIGCRIRIKRTRRGR
ncbi:MAG: thioredoxin family protein [Planctomycetota bacterium]